MTRLRVIQTRIALKNPRLDVADALASVPVVVAVDNGTAITLIEEKNGKKEAAGSTHPRVR